MHSLRISGAINLMVKVDATDEIFTRNIILKKKKSAPPSLLLAALLFGASQTSTESWTGAH